MTTTGYPRAFGSYVLLERLGQGGMSEVDLARRAVDTADFVRFLVIKRIQAQLSGDDSFVRMFHDEARINAELHHENIASVYDFGQQGQQFFLAMEYVPGCDLRRVQRLLVRQGKHFPLRMGLRVIADVLAALDYAHSRVDTYGHSMNIVHRDVNPRNIMLSVRGEVKLIDFGVAKSDNRAEHTVGHALKGKFAYMAPEQIDATRQIDGRADIFAVGIVLHELLVGASPFAGLSEVQTMHRILAGQIATVTSSPGRKIPDAVLNVHDRALATNADRRYRTAGAMRDAVIAASAELGGLPAPPELAEFVRNIDPEASTVSKRLEEWREGNELSVSHVRPAADLPGPGSESGTLANRDRASQARASAADASSSRSSSQTVAGPALVAAAGVGGGLGLLLILVLGAAAWWMTRQPQPATTTPPPATTAADPAEALATTPPASTPPASPPPASTPQTTDVPSPRPASAADASAADRAAARQAATDQAIANQRASRAAAQAAAQAATQAATDQAAADQAATQAAADQAAADQAAAQAAAEQAAADQAAADQAAAGGGASQTASTTSSTVTGFVNISSRPKGLRLSIDGHSQGITPARALELSVGTHTIVVSDPDTGQRWTRQVTIEEGRSQVIVLGDGT